MGILRVTESVRIKGIEFIENVIAFCPKGQNKLFVIIMCPVYQATVRKAEFGKDARYGSIILIH